MLIVKKEKKYEINISNDAIQSEINTYMHTYFCSLVDY